MNVWMLWVTGFVAGAAAGAAFLAGLWWTTRRLPGATNVAGLFLASFVVRMAFVLSIFWLLARTGRWEPMAAGAAGFTLVRVLAVRRVRADDRKEAP